MLGSGAGARPPIPGARVNVNSQAHGSRTYSGEDWDALEKRLADTRDRLHDILLHLRKVLDSLKSVSDGYRRTGRTWRDNAGTRHANAPGAGTRGPGATGPNKAKATGQAKPGPETFNTRQEFKASQTGPKSQPGQAQGFSWSGRGAQGTQQQTKTGYQAKTDFQAKTGFKASSPGQPGGQKAQDRDFGQRAKTSGTGATGRQSNQDSTGTRQDWQQRQEQQEARRQQRERQYQQRQQQRQPRQPIGGPMTLTQACALLCVSYPSNSAEIKAAYRRLARRHHPDLGGDEEMMKSLNLAYEMALAWCSPVRNSATWTM